VIQLLGNQSWWTVWGQESCCQVIYVERASALRSVSIWAHRGSSVWPGCQLYWTGCWQVPIHRRDPTTDQHGDFCLLRFRPGPLRPSLDNLVTLNSLNNYWNSSTYHMDNIDLLRTHVYGC
jgi:hypothetical protein